MQDLRGKKLVLLGFTLFSMFFGAGNLIFPPHLGAQAGANLWPAFAGFAISAIGLPIMGVAAVANAGGLDRLASRVHPKFALAFAILVYLSIGLSSPQWNAMFVGLISSVFIVCVSINIF